MSLSDFEKCLHVKKLIERFSRFPDIGITSRKRELTDLRKIYCKICKTTTKASGDIIGSALRPSFGNASVLSNVKRFDELFHTNQLLFINVYHSVLNKLDKKDSGYNDALIDEYTTFLNWFRTEVHETTPIDSSFFVGKYFSINSEK